MTALSGNYDAQEKDGKLQANPVGAAKRLYQGALVVTDDTTGLLEAGSDTAGKTFAGIAYEPADNTGGGAAAITCRVQKRGSVVYAFSGSLTNAALGKKAYIVDSGTVALAATTANDVYCGDIVAIESGRARIRIDRAAS